MNITITTTAKTDEEATALLTSFSFPFRKSAVELSTDTADVNDAVPLEEELAAEVPVDANASQIEENQQGDK
jgi:hypothetical protein